MGSNPTVGVTLAEVYLPKSYTCGGRSINTTKEDHMQKLIETLKSFGIEVPEDKQAEVKKALSEHYKNAAEHNKAVSKLETDRDAWKQKAETAEETLKKFDGVDLETMQTELVTWQQKAKDAEKDYADKLAQRDFEDALKEEIGGYKFTSEAAKKAIMAEIREAGLKVKDGKILGLSDLLAQMKEKDVSAFVDEQQEQLEAGRAKPFTRPLNSSGSSKKMTREEIEAIKDPAEMQQRIAENIHLFRR